MRLVQAQADEPAKQQVVLELLDQQPLAPHRIQHLQQQRAQQLLGRNRRPAEIRIQGFEFPREASQGGIDDAPDRPQRVIGRHALLRREVAKQEIRSFVGTSHRPAPSWKRVRSVYKELLFQHPVRRGLSWLRGLLDESETDQVMMLPACPRCHGTAVKPLGMAGSDLPWFTCAICDAVWAARDPTLDQEAPSADVPTLVSHQPGPKQILIADDDGGVLTLLTKILVRLPRPHRPRCRGSVDLGEHHVR